MYKRGRERSECDVMLPYFRETSVNKCWRFVNVIYYSIFLVAIEVYVDRLEVVMNDSAVLFRRFFLVFFPPLTGYIDTKNT